MPRLDGKIAIVTGSYSGIGQAIAENLAQEGADIVVVFLKDRDGAEKTRQRVEAAGRRAFVSNTDVRNEAAVTALFERVRSELGEPFILVNNAGIGSSGKPVAETTLEEWDDVVRTDLYGPFLCCREFIKGRKAAGAGWARSSTSPPFTRRSRAPATGRLWSRQGRVEDFWPQPCPGTGAGSDQREQHRPRPDRNALD